VNKDKHVAKMKYARAISVKTVFSAEEVYAYLSAFEGLLDYAVARVVSPNSVIAALHKTLGKDQ